MPREWDDLKARAVHGMLPSPSGWLPRLLTHNMWSFGLPAEVPGYRALKAKGFAWEAVAADLAQAQRDTRY